MTLYQRTGRHDDAMQCCYDVEQSQSLKDSKKWNSFVIEVCENFQVGKNDYINLNLHNYVLQMENVGGGSFQFSSTYLASLDKLLEIMTQDFDESSVFTSTDVLYSILHKMDQALYQLESVTHSRCRKAVSHFKGQLYMWCATLLNKRSESDLGPHSDRSKLAFLLFAGAYSADMSAQYWATGGARNVMSGHMLGLLTGTPNWNMEMLSGLVDLPLSPAFLKLLSGGEVSGCVMESSTIVTMYSPEFLEDVMTLSWLCRRRVKSSPRSEMFSGGRDCWSLS